MKKIYIIMAAVLMLSMAGCGSSDKGEASMSAPPEAASRAMGSGVNYAADSFAEEAPAEDYYEEAYSEGSDGGEGESAVLDSETAEKQGKSSRKLITTVNISTETDDVDDFAARMEKRIEALGGYVESSNVYSNKDYYSNDTRSADITARIPAERLKEFLNDVDGSSNITSRSINTKDVTLDYTDTEAHERALEAEQKSLETMMGHAETMEDIIAIQSQLTDVRYRLDSIRSQLRSYDNDITYSTVYLNVTETKKFTVTKEETRWERIQNGFTENLLDVMDSISEFIIWFLTHIPSLIVFGIFVFAVIMFVRAIRRASVRRKEARGNMEKRDRKDRKDKPDTVIMNDMKKRPLNAAPGKAAAPSSGPEENKQ